MVKRAYIVKHWQHNDNTMTTQWGRGTAGYDGELLFSTGMYIDIGKQRRQSAFIARPPGLQFQCVAHRTASNFTSCTQQMKIYALQRHYRAKTLWDSSKGARCKRDRLLATSFARAWDPIILAFSTFKFFKFTWGHETRPPVPFGSAKKPRNIWFRFIGCLYRLFVAIKPPR